MMLLLGRYGKSSGYAPSWFYVLAAIGFAALTVWAVVQRDWVVAGVAVAMVGMTAVVAMITRRLRAALEASVEARGPMGDLEADEPGDHR